jgi:hypothetical protein
MAVGLIFYQRFGPMDMGRIHQSYEGFAMPSDVNNHLISSLALHYQTAGFTILLARRGTARPMVFILDKLGKRSNGFYFGVPVSFLGAEPPPGLLRGFGACMK